MPTPTQTAKVIASAPTRVSPGYLTSIRVPRRKSSDMPVSQASPRASCPASLYFSTPPKAIAACRRASASSSPRSRTSRSASMSMWKRISSSISAYIARALRSWRA